MPDGNQSFDYVIVGGGSAGCVLAARLSEDSGCRVLLLEAGPRDNSMFIHAPGGLLPILHLGWFSRMDQTVPQIHADGRVMVSPRGLALGGSSATNGMIYDRGSPHDYDIWRQLGNEGWAYADVLPYFKRAERHELGGDAFHGADGPLRVSRTEIAHPLARAFVEAGRQAGHPFNPDMNGARREGFGPTDVTLARGRRSSTARVYLRPALSRPNLTVITGAKARRVLLEGTRAVGVEYRRVGAVERIHAAREVILSAGAIISPQLLMLSGIGPAAQLAEHGIRMAVDLPGVGENYRDHLAVSVRHACKIPISLFNFLNPLAAARAAVTYLLTRKGPLAQSSVEAVAFMKLFPQTEHPDIKIHLAMALYENFGRKIILSHGFFGHVDILDPDSVGRLTLRSADPDDPPLIDPNILSTPRDRLLARETVKTLRHIFAQSAFDPYRGEELAPGPQVRTDEEIDAYVRQTASADIHTVGTCRMGHDSGAVVDERLRVHGVGNLRVVDASVMPRLPGGNTNAPTIMIAEKAADMIRGLPPLPRTETARRGEHAAA